MSGELVNIVNPYDDTRFHPSERIAQRVRSALYVPVCDSAGAIRGVLVAANKQGSESFSPEDEDIAKQMAGFVAAVLSRCARRLNDPADVAVLQIRDREVGGAGWREK